MTKGRTLYERISQTRGYRAWMRFAHVLGWIQTRILLSILYYLVLTPMALVLRVAGRDPMNRAFRRKVESYRRLRSPRDAQHMERQF